VFGVRIYEKKLIKTGAGGYSKTIILPKSWLLMNEVTDKVFMLTSRNAPELIIFIPYMMPFETVTKKLEQFIDDMRHIEE